MAPVFVYTGKIENDKEREREKEREDDRQFSIRARARRVRVWCNPNSKRSTNNEICERLEAFVGALGVKKQRNRGTEIEKKRRNAPANASVVIFSLVVSMMVASRCVNFVRRKRSFCCSYVYRVLR